jgi:exopolyphosphatase/guanosine-5'-triphosphate,3'-diphosphate pyrophosphatase
MAMRLGVLDVGSNTVHLLVVDAHSGAHPWPAHSQKSALRLAERIGRNGMLTRDGADALVSATTAARAAAAQLGTDDFMAFATSAVRDATNSADVLARVRNETGVELRVLSGTEEARLTFLAVRRWFGWSAGRLLVVDIGGGSLEMAVGIDEDPAVALSVPLGAGRLTRRLPGNGDRATRVPPVEAIDDLSAHIEAILGSVVGEVTAGGWDRPVATSKTFRMLARICGAAPSAAGLWAPRSLRLAALRQVIGFIRRMSPAALAEIEGVSPDRAHQVLAGALVAEATMRRLAIDEVAICPWALREGVILRRLDALDG